MTDTTNSFKTKIQYFGWSFVVIAAFVTTVAIVEMARGVTVDDALKLWATFIGIALFMGTIMIAINELFARMFSMPSSNVPSTEDRLDELERLKRRDMVTPEEYAAKRQEILKDL